jgi:hypothetical protein
MHFRILPDHLKNVLKKDIFDRLEWLKTCFDAFSHTSRPPESCPSEKRVLMHLRIFPDHQKLFFKKDIIERLERLKTCFDAFSHTSRPPETLFQKRYF